MTDTEKLQGTIAYMSPEQIKRDPDIDFRSDIFSLGVVLYEILAGQLPAIAETVDEMSNKILNDKPANPASVTNIAIPDLLENVTMRCLAKDPNDRIRSCGELIRLLEEDWG